jgi:endonuclease/exonuclease/phosphatase family metal-dependent hydrolase
MVEARPLRVATYNIQHGSTGSYKDPGDPELAAEVCRQLDADILGLQEVDRGIPRSAKVNMAAVIAKECNMDYYFASTRSHRGRGRFGNALLVRGEIKNVEVLQLRGDWQRVAIGRRKLPLVPEPRNAIIANVATQEHELAVGVTHTGGRTRKEMVGLAAAALLTHDGPYVLLGDFNTNLVPARETLEPYGFGVLTPTYATAADSPQRRHPQIDHIAIKGLRCVSREVREVEISDHDPFIADLILPHRI